LTSVADCFCVAIRRFFFIGSRCTREYSCNVRWSISSAYEPGECGE
jgi:hypothetical protein